MEGSGERKRDKREAEKKNQRGDSANEKELRERRGSGKGRKDE